MNRQTRADLRSLALHRQIARCLQEDPTLWSIPQQNIERWLASGTFGEDLLYWQQLFQNKTKEQILEIVTSESEEATRLRSSSPFTGVLDQDTRTTIFRLFLASHTFSDTSQPAQTAESTKAQTDTIS